MQAEFTLADLTKITGAKRRSVQLWAEAGVILADTETERAGTGTHRKFSRDEAIIACIIGAIAPFQISIGRLKSFAQYCRDALSGQRKAITREDIEAAINERRNVYAILTLAPDAGTFRLVASKMKSRYRFQALFGRHMESILNSPRTVAVTFLLNKHLANLR